MAAPTSQQTSGSPEAPFPLTAPRRTPVQASSSSSLDSIGLTSARSSSSSLSPPRTPDNISATHPSNTLSRPPTSHCIAPSCPIPNQTLFADPHQRSLAHPPSPPRSVPSEPSPAPGLQTQATCRSWASTPRFRGPWLQSSIGMAGLAVALVGLFFFTYRSYKMEKYDNLMALYQACASLKQAGLTTGGVQCDDTLAKGPPPRPYERRDLRSIPAKSFKFVPICTADGLERIRPGVWNEPIWHTAFIITLCLGMVVLAVWLMFHLRYQSRTGTVYQSAAKNEGSLQVTQHYAGVSETETLSGPLELIRSIPPIGNTINNVRRRLVHDIHDGEAATKSKISLRPSIAGSSTSTLFNQDRWAKEAEHHDGLIELKRTKDTRNFLDPKTGETLHLSRWKSREESRDEKDKDEDHDKGDVHRVITQMGVGSAVFGGRTAATKALYEKAQVEPSQDPQQMGNTLANLVKNGPASVGDALKGTLYDICM